MDKQVNVKGMDRYLSVLDVWAMAFGCMVGWGAFVMPGTTFLPVDGPAGTILAMTANAFREDVQAAMEAGMQAHVAKPIDVSALTKTLQSVLKSGK